MATTEAIRVIISDEEISDSEYLWTISKFQDELFQELSNCTKPLDNNGVVVETQPYYNQARELMYLIPISKPTIPFEINRSDLSEGMRKRIVDLKKENHPREFKEIIIEAVGKIFENINAKYYHESVRRCLKVKFV